MISTMRAPIRLVEGGWPAFLQNRLSRFVRRDPRLLLDPAVDAEDFQAVMSSIHVGSTIKITGSGRHLAGNALLAEHVDLAGRRVVDLGASDGTSSLELEASGARLVMGGISISPATITSIGAQSTITDSITSALNAASTTINTTNAQGTNS